MSYNIFRASVVTLALIPAACGDSEQAATIEPQATTTNAPTTTEGDAAEPTAEVETTTTTAAPDVPAGLEDLERMSLKLADMPAGWSESIPEPDDSSSAFCIENGDSLIDTDAWPKVEKEFSAGTFGPFLSTSTMVAPGENEAKDLVQQFAELAAQCTSWSDADGSYALAPVNYPGTGDETFAIRLTIESDGFTILGDAIVIREGKILTLLLPLGVATPVEAETVVGWMNLVDERD